MKAHLVPLIAFGLIALFNSAFATNPKRQAEVAQRGAEVMPFSLMATTHVFTKTADGGTLQLVVKNTSDAQQIGGVRAHLKMMQSRFQHGDFSGPAYIHGADMPGLAQLQAANAGDLLVSYQDTDDGAQLHFRTADADLVRSIHAWFDAQVSDHGVDARAGTQNR